MSQCSTQNQTHRWHTAWCRTQGAHKGIKPVCVVHALISKNVWLYFMTKKVQAINHTYIYKAPSPLLLLYFMPIFIYCHLNPVVMAPDYKVSDSIRLIKHSERVFYILTHVLLYFNLPRIFIQPTNSISTKKDSPLPTFVMYNILCILLRTLFLLIFSSPRFWNVFYYENIHTLYTVWYLRYLMEMCAFWICSSSVTLEM